MIQVDKGIPIPKGHQGGRRKIYPFEMLEVGDSFLLKGKGRATVTLYNQRMAPKRFISRGTSWGIRVWRVK